MITEGNCTVTAGNTSVTVNHGHGAAPDGVWVSPKDDLAGRGWWIDHTAITAVQFILNIQNMDGFSNHVFRYVCADAADVTEGTCTVVAGNTSITVNHGHGSAPTGIWVIPEDDLLGRRYWVDYTSITAAQFTMYIAAVDHANNHRFHFFCNLTFTEGNCTILTDTSSIVVTHGHGGVPSSIWVQAKEDLNGRTWYIDYTSITATQFTLHIDSMDVQAFDFRFFCYGSGSGAFIGTKLGGNVLLVWHDGFEETITLISTEWKAWDITIYAVVNKLHIHGRSRYWRLRCFETGVDWASSVVQTLQGYVGTNSLYNFSVTGVHTVNTTVKVVGVALELPEGTNIGTRDRNFIVKLQEIT